MASCFLGLRGVGSTATTIAGKDKRKEIKKTFEAKRAMRYVRCDSTNNATPVQ